MNSLERNLIIHLNQCQPRKRNLQDFHVLGFFVVVSIATAAILKYQNMIPQLTKAVSIFGKFHYVYV